MLYESGEGGGKVIKGSPEAVSRLEIRGPKLHTGSDQKLEVWKVERG